MIELIRLKCPVVVCDDAIVRQVLHQLQQESVVNSVTIRLESLAPIRALSEAGKWSHCSEVEAEKGTVSATRRTRRNTSDDAGLLQLAMSEADGVVITDDEHLVRDREHLLAKLGPELRAVWATHEASEHLEELPDA